MNAGVIYSEVVITKISFYHNQIPHISQILTIHPTCRALKRENRL
jgi:hypothetical protein